MNWKRTRLGTVTAYTATDGDVTAKVMRYEGQAVWTVRVWHGAYLFRETRGSAKSRDSKRLAEELMTEAVR